MAHGGGGHTHKAISPVLSPRGPARLRALPKPARCRRAKNCTVTAPRAGGEGMGSGGVLPPAGSGGRGRSPDTPGEQGEPRGLIVGRVDGGEMLPAALGVEAAQPYRKGGKKKKKQFLWAWVTGTTQGLCHRAGRGRWPAPAASHHGGSGSPVGRVPGGRAGTPAGSPRRGAGLGRGEPFVAGPVAPCSAQGQVSP